MSFFIIFISAFLASAIAFLSGFGFLTIVMPVLAFFLPIPIAITVTALSHLIHLIIKLALTIKSINYSIAFRFGVVALLFAIPGTYSLQYLSDLLPFYIYHIGSVPIQMTYLKLSIGIILLLVVLLETKKLNFSKLTSLFPSAAISGFIGGMT